MTSSGMEHVYLQQWLVAFLGADLFIQDTITEGRVVQLPMDEADVPAIGLRASPAQDYATANGGRRTMATIPYGIEAQKFDLDIEPLLPVMNRVDVLLQRVKNVVWVAPDGSTLTIYNARKDRGYSDTVTVSDQHVQIVGGDWSFQCEVQLTGDVLA
jgi:hypothetical protein